MSVLYVKSRINHRTTPINWHYWNNKQTRCSRGCSINTFKIRWSFHSESSRHCLSKTVRAGELKFWENCYPPPCVTCTMSHAMCQVSCVTRQVSGVTCQESHVKCPLKKLQIGGACCGRLCYQMATLST